MIELLQVTEENTNDWLALRQRTIGATDIVSISGMNPFSSALQVWMAKTGKLGKTEENDAMWIGHQSEEMVAKLFKRKEPNEGEPVRAQVLCANEQYPWATATPDYWLKQTFAQGLTVEQALTVQDKILEIKTQNARALPQWDDGAPRDKVIQVMWQLGVTGLSVAHIAALIGGFDYRSAKVEFDKDLFATLIQLADRFRDFVEKDIPPCAGPNDAKLIKSLIPEREGVIAMPLQAIDLAKQWTAASAEAKEIKMKLDEAEDKKKEAENNLILLMGSATEGIVDVINSGEREKLRCTVKKIERKGYTVETTSYNRFNLKWEKV